MKEKVHTTGQTRSYLLGLLYRIEHQQIPLETADRLCKVISRIHESIHCENRTKLVAMAAGEQLSEFGSLLIGDVKDATPRLAFEADKTGLDKTDPAQLGKSAKG